MADDIQSVMKKKKMPMSSMKKQDVDKARKFVDRMSNRSAFEAESIKQSLGTK